MNSSIVVLIDQFTRDTVASITYDVLSKHVEIITDIKELSDQHFQSDVVIFEPAFMAIVTPEILEELKESLQIRVFAVYQTAGAGEQLQGKAKTVQANYSVLDWNFVYAVVNDDLAILEPYQKSTEVIDGFKAIDSQLPKELKDYFMRFRGSYAELVRCTSDIVSANAGLKEQLNIQETIGKQTIAGLSEMKELLDQAQDKTKAYEALLSADYDITFTGFYPERPRVLYIKSISHAAGMDLLLNVLFSVITKQYKSSCKIVKLVDSGNALDMRYIPNIYTPVTDSYNTSEVLQNDFILKLSGYSVMMDLLMLNRSSLEYLIVHDMRGTLKPALDATLVDLRVNEMSADYALLGEYDDVLSDLEGQVAFPWSFKECQKFTGTRSVRLANHPTIASILDRLM